MQKNRKKNKIINTDLIYCSIAFWNHILGKYKKYKVYMYKNKENN